MNRTPSSATTVARAARTSPWLFSGRISLFALISLALLFAFAACDGGTITIDETEDGVVVRSTGPTEPGATRSSRPTGPTATPEPTATPRPRIPFPPESDGAALIALFDATNGDSWQNSDGWLYTEDIGQWHGVTTGTGGRVTELNLSGNGLSGELPEELGSFTSLTELDLRDNRLSGKLPPELGSLSNLEELYLSNNRLTGALPASLTALTGLTDLYLHDNQFSGVLPAELGALPNLESVTIGGNKFLWADSYPPGMLADLVGLSALYASAGGDGWADNANWLSDPAVASWSGVSIDGDGLVTGLDLSQNGLSGELPPALGNLAGLTQLDLSGNQLAEEIPAELGRLTGLTELHLHSNQLSGKLPADLGFLTGLTVLRVDNNQLDGALPAEVGNLSNLTELRLHSNRLSGQIPAGLGSLGNLTDLYLHDNQFSGELPSELGSLAVLEQVSLWGNQLSWAESYPPGILADMVALMALYDSAGGENWANSSNWLTAAPVGEWHGVTAFNDRVTELDLGQNQLSGEIPPQLGSLANLETLLLWQNQLTGEIPPTLGSLANLTALSLRNNELSGEIPPELGSLTNLTALGLNYNQLSGTIPPELGSLSNLERLSLNDNQLSGPVPAELGNLSNLTLLYLDTNQLSGELPSELGNLANLRQVSIWDNKLTGADSYANGYLADMVALVALYESAIGPEWQATLKTVPGRWASSKNWLNYNPLGQWDGVTTSGSDGSGRVTELDFRHASSQNQPTGLIGKIPPELGLLTALEKLNIQNNPQLTGPIPPELGNLTNLTDMNLSHAGLSGPIPPELGRLASLKKLNLASNQLSGPVPAELGNLANLTLLYLDNNGLSGELPSELGNLANLRQVSIWGNKLTWASSYANGYLADMVALVALYESAIGPEWQAILKTVPGRWVSSKNWLNYNPLGQWDGVTTSGSDGSGRVTELDFRHASSLYQPTGLIGKIPPELGLLTALEKLNIQNNPQLTGELPPELGNLTSLEKLNLSGNQLTGELPPELGNLTNLTELYLYSNSLSGEIPPELGSLTNLTALGLNGNQLSGTIPPELGSLTNLTALYLDNNGLSGELPSELGNLANLRQVSIWGNKLTWASSYANGYLADMVALVALYESAIGPEWQAILKTVPGRWVSSKNWLNYNPLGQWDGVTTSGSDGSGRVTELDFRHASSLYQPTGLIGKIPPELGLLTALEKLNIQNNPQLTGCIPSSLRGIEYTGDLPFCN